MHSILDGEKLFLQIDSTEEATALWHNMLNIATLNAFIMFKAMLLALFIGGVTHARKLFIKEPGKQLAYAVHENTPSNTIAPETHQKGNDTTQLDLPL